MARGKFSHCTNSTDFVFLDYHEGNGVFFKLKQRLYSRVLEILSKKFRDIELKIRDIELKNRDIELNFRDIKLKI